MSKFERDTLSYEPLPSVVPIAEMPMRLVSVPVFEVLSRFVKEGPEDGRIRVRWPGGDAGKAHDRSRGQEKIEGFICGTVH
jgi:hypothetical protein